MLTVRRHVQIDDSGGPDACHPWMGAKDSWGYAVVRKGRRDYKVHRQIYELANGPIPKGLVIDHTCHNGTGCPGGKTCQHRACVNPRHLEAVTLAENKRRGNSPAAVNARKTHCINGHALTDDNLVQGTHGRACKTCHRDRARKRSGYDGPKTHCIHGHALEGDNVYLRPDGGGRQCRECNRQRQRVALARKMQDPAFREAYRQKNTERNRRWRQKRSAD